MSQWQKMDNAPQDRDVLVRLGNGEVFRARYYPQDKCWKAASDIGWINARWWAEMPDDPEAS